MNSERDEIKKRSNGLETVENGSEKEGDPFMKTLQLTDLLHYSFLSAPAASPDGSKCAFVVSRCDEAANGYQSWVYLFDRRTRAIRPMSGLGKEQTVCWLDDDTLLFSSDRDPKLAQQKAAGESWTCYYALSLSGGEAAEYLRIPMKVSKLLPIDEDRFALAADYHMDQPDPHGFTKTERETFLRERRSREESYLIADEIPFRNDGQGFRNGIRSRLYLYTRSSDTLKPLTEETQNVEFFNVSNHRIIYSARHFTKDSPKRFDLSGMCIYDVDTDRLHDYVDESAYRMRYCGFLGEVPVFLGSDGLRYGYQENPYFFYIDEKEGRERIFAENQRSASNSVGTDSRYGGGETIAPGEQHIYFVSTEGGSAQLKRVGLDGTIEQLTDWEGSMESFARCGDEVIFVGMLENKPQELYSLRDGQYERLSSFHEWVWTERTLSPPEKVTYVSDGVPLEGYVIRPVGFCPGQKYPGILYIHGGHKLAFGPVFYHEMQLWANQGYFVFYCNPRGSDGCDNDFAHIIGKYGYDDYADVMKFTDVCLKRYPEMDGDRLGVGGGSYGGFLTNWIIGHTDRFRCAVSQRSIASFLSMFGTSDTSYLFPMWQFDTDPWMDAERYWEHSPLKYADHAKTPTLFIHAEEDYRCPLSEGIQMFYALKYHGVEARLCIFRGECHELSRAGKPKNRVNRLLEITNWWNGHLK